MSDDEVTLVGIADELYALPMAEFTPARDARAKALKGTDAAALAGPVKALKKPSLAAWVINLGVAELVIGRRRRIAGAARESRLARNRERAVARLS